MKIATAFSGGFSSVEFALKYLDIPRESSFSKKETVAMNLFDMGVA